LLRLDEERGNVCLRPDDKPEKQGYIPIQSRFTRL